MDLLTGKFEYFNYYIDLVGSTWCILADFGKLNRVLDRKETFWEKAMVTTSKFIKLKDVTKD